MVSRSKYKRVVDLYTVGAEAVLRDGTVMWVQVPNPFEYDECRHDASVARSRVVMALKDDGDELVKLKGAFYEHGPDAVCQDLVDARAGEYLLKALDGIREDPDWRERMEILDRSEELIGRPPEDSERKLLTKLAEEYQAEIQKRLGDETDFLMRKYRSMGEDELWKEFLDFYADRRASEVGMAEYKLTEMWFATRCCEGVETDGSWDHSACDGHRIQVYETKDEVRGLPLDLQRTLYIALESVSMTEREAKKKGSPTSSSASSERPSEAAESTPSTPVETSDAPRGSSPLPSLMG